MEGLPIAMFDYQRVIFVGLMFHFQVQMSLSEDWVPINLLVNHVVRNGDIIQWKYPRFSDRPTLVIYVYIYVYLYIYIYMYIHICIYRYVYIDMYIYV